MFKTRWRKILSDIRSRKMRTTLVSASIFVGVLGVVTLFSASEILINQLESDIQQDRLAMLRAVVTSSRDAEIDNEATLATLNAFPGTTSVEARSVYPFLWKLPGEDRFRDGTIAAYTVPIDQMVMEPPRVVEGDFPEEGQNQIAIERHMADRWNLDLGDTIDIRILSDLNTDEILQESFTVSAILFQPYGETRGPGFADYDSLVFAAYVDAQHVAGFNGLSHIYARFVDYPTAEDESTDFQAAIANETPYIPAFAATTDPAKNPIIENTRQTNGVLIMLAMIALIVSGFLVVNVINSIVVEQRRQIGVLKSIGASRWDNFYIYAGMALVYGLIGVVPGVLLGIPAGYSMAQALADQNNTFIESFTVSPTGIILGIMMGLLVPLLAAIFPVFNGTRVSIRDAMTDLGISSDYGKTRLARYITALPFPLTVRQALHNVNQKKFRLALTGTTLTIAVGAFMGIFAVFTQLDNVVNDIFDAYGNPMSIEPNEGHSFESIETLIMSEEFTAQLEEKGLLMPESIDPGAQLAVEIEGYDPPLNQAGPPGISGYGVNTNNPVLFELNITAGTDWENDPDLEGVVVSSRIANNSGKTAGDSIVITAGGNSAEFTVLGVAQYPFDWVWLRYEDLATLGGLYLNPSASADEREIYPNSIPIVLNEADPSAEEVDAVIEEMNEYLISNGITANFTNWVEFQDFIAQFLLVFNIILNLAAALIALVGAIGLLTTLSMSVFERQKEIGVMRSVGASSWIITLQFLIEGLIIGIVAWLIGIPVGYLISMGLNAALPFEELGSGFPVITIVLGLVGMLVVVTIASLWPSMAAARRTISDILRYQ